MDPEKLRSVMHLPEHIDPIDILINDKTRFFHSMSQYSHISWPELQDEDVIRTIALAAGEVVNQRVLYHFFLDYMPDDRARSLLEVLLEKNEYVGRHNFWSLMESNANSCRTKGTLCSSYG